MNETISSHRQVKRCPQCGTMTFTETNVCQTCGRQFLSNAYAPPPEFNPDRTQMLTLPPMLTHPAQPRAAAPQQDGIGYIEPTLPTRPTPIPLIAICFAVGLLLTTFAWLLLH